MVSGYRLEALLGEGGMGVVYRARDVRLERTVALKFVRPELLQHPDARKRFVREARVLASLDHPNLCTIHGLQEADEQLFMVMAYVEGRTLHEHLAEGPLDAEHALPLMKKLTAGLQAAHRRGVVHRDLKSSNVMLTPTGEPKLIDFGLARRAEDSRLTQTGVTTGTVSFMSPEQLEGEEPDQRSDIFSLGVVFHHLLTGVQPYARATMGATVQAILNGDPPPFDAALPEKIRALEPLVVGCLKQDPAQRFQSVDELLSALEASDDPVALKRLVPGTRGTRARSWVAWALAACAVILLLMRPDRGARPSWRANALAVIEFENLTGDPSWNWMERGVAELMNSALARSEELDIYDSQRLAWLVEESPSSETLDGRAAIAVLRRAGIPRMITGVILLSNDRLRLQARVIDVDSGHILTSEVAEGEPGADVFVLAASMIGSLQTFLEIDVLGSRTGDEWLREITTDSVEAYRLFLRGREEFLASHWNEARSQYEQALEYDGDFVTARIDLIGCYWNIGAYEKMGECLERAQGLRDRASHKEALNLDLIDAVIHRRGGEIVRLAGQLLEYVPENRFFLYLLGRGHWELEHYERCIEILAPLIEERWTWSWTYVLTGTALRALGDETRAEEALRLGMEVSGEDPEVAYEYALLELGRGNDSRGRTLLETALQHARITATPECEAHIRLELAHLDEERGQKGAARSHYERILVLVGQDAPVHASAEEGLARLR
ncbi:MAG: protein kinase [Planctomycetota bacterium]